MRENKIAIWIVSIFSIMVLIIAYFLNVNSIDFWCNVCLGIFGSAVLTVMSATINYWSERRRTLEQFWIYGHKALRSIGRYPINGTVADKTETIQLISEFDLQGFDDAYGGINFLYKNKQTRRRIYYELYFPIREAICMIAERASDIRRFCRYTPDNPNPIELYVKEIDDLLIATESGCILGPGFYNKFTQLCNERFNGFYYKIMYPIKSRRKKNAD